MKNDFIIDKNRICDILGTELGNGIIQLAEKEPVLKKALVFKDERQLTKNLSAVIVLLIDNHVKRMANVCDFLKKNEDLMKSKNTDILSTMIG